MSGYSRYGVTPRRRRPILFWLAPIGIVILILVGVSFSYFTSHYNERTLDDCTVTDKDRGYDRDTGSSQYRVYTTCGTFSNEDSLWWGKFNSGDLQGQLEEGKTYSITVAGARIPFMSMFPNIYQVEQANG